MLNRVVIIIVACLLTASETALAQAKPCAGKNLFDELAASDPDTHTRIMRAAESESNGTAILWRIERENTAPSYLFGTLHLSDERITKLPESARRALDGAKQVLLETADVSAEATAAALAGASKAALFAGEQSLEQLLTAEEYKKAVKALDKVGLPGAVAHLYRPWLVSMLISVSDCERARVKRGAEILDMRIAAAATARGIDVMGLETIEQQLESMASVPDEQQLAMLRANLATYDLSNDLMETMVQLYLERRVSTVWELQLALAEKAGIPRSAFDGFKAAVVVARNERMRDAALPFLEKGGVFIAVGAMHLPGTTGLVELIRKQGYTVSPVE